MTRILWISPVGVERSVDDVERILTDAKRPETEVDVTALDRGPPHVEYHYYESLVLPDVETFGPGTTNPPFRSGTARRVRG